MPRIWLVNVEADGFKGTQIVRQDPLPWYIQARQQLREVDPDKNLIMVGYHVLEYAHGFPGLDSINDFDAYVEKLKQGKDEELLNGIIIDTSASPDPKHDNPDTPVSNDRLPKKRVQKRAVRNKK